MPTVDNLDIQISAQATKANASLTTLINRLDRVSASLMGVNSRGMATMGAGVNKLTNSMQNFSNATKTADFSRLARNLSSIGSIDGERVKAAASGIQSFAGALGSLNKIPVSDSSLKIAELAKGISQLGYKSSTQAIDNIPKLATAMSQLMRELSKAPMVSRNLIDMTNALAKLSRTGASSGRAAKSLGSSLDRYTLSTTRATKGTFSLASALGKMYATYWLLFRAFGKIGDAINIASDLTEVQNVVDVTFGNMASKVEEFAQTSIKQFGMSELTMKQVASRFQAMGSAMNIDNGSIANAQKYLNTQTNGYVELSDSMADVSLTLTKLTADMASFYNVEQEAVAEDLQSIFTSQTKPLRAYGLDLTEINLKQWAMTQGLNSNIDAMTQAEKTMLRYQYVLAHTGAAQGDFARTSESWANQIRILRQQFEQLGIIVGKTFIAALKPLIKALNNAMSHIIAFAQTVSDALGKIFGWKFEVGGGGITDDMDDASDGAGGIADGLGEAVDNAKKLKQQLQGFDELNVLTTNSDSDSGKGNGGGAGAGGGGASGNKWVEQESILEAFESEIDTLYKLGEYIGKTLIDSMKSIDWDSVYKQAEGFGKGLADFLNGLISPELFYETGKTISNSINTAFHSLNSFGKTFEWDEFGSSLAFGLKGFLENWDAELTGETFSTFAKGLLTTMTSFLITSMEEDTFEDFGQKVVDFICGIDWGGLAWDLLEFFEALTNALTEIPADFAAGVGNAIIDKIFGEDANIEIDSDMIQKSLKKSLSKVKGLDIAFMFVDMKNKFEEAKNIFSPITDALSSAKENWKTNLRDFLENDVKPIFGEDLWSEIVSVIKDNPLKAFSEMRDGWKEDISAWWNEDVAPHFDGGAWSLLTGVIASALDGSLYEMIKEWNKDIKKWWNEDVKPWFAEKNWTFDGIKEGISKAWENAIEAVKGLWNKFAGWFNDALTINLDPITILGKTVFDGGEFKIAHIPTFQTGGYVPASYSMFMAGENGTPELLGTVGGRTAVAGGAEITGIREEIRATSNEEIALLKQQNALLQAILEKEFGITERQISNAVVRQNKQHVIRTGKPLFA